MPDKTINSELDQHDKIQAEIAKLMAETAKINSENRYYPIIITATATLALVAIVKLFV